MTQSGRQNRRLTRRSLMSGTAGLVLAAGAALVLRRETLVPAPDAQAATAGGGQPPPARPAPARPATLPRASEPPGVPYILELEDHSAGTAKTIGRLELDAILPDLIYDDPALAAWTGPIGQLAARAPLDWDGFRWSARRWKLPRQGRDGGDWHQLVVFFKPQGRWATYPFQDTYRQPTDRTHPRAFKWIVRDSAGTALGRIEMHDGKPVNDPSLPQLLDKDRAVRPHVTCAMLLYWENQPPATRADLDRIVPRHEPVGDWCGKSLYATKDGDFALSESGQFDGHSGNIQANGSGNIYFLPEWPQPNNDDYARRGTGDSYADPGFSSGYQFYRVRAMGWRGHAYEPGAFAGWSWFTRNGGPGHVRGYMHEALQYWRHHPQARRLHDGTPWQDISWNVAKGMFNLGVHWIGNVDAPAPVDTRGDLYQRFALNNFVYGPVNHPAASAIDMRMISSPMKPASEADPTGLPVWGGFMLDAQHHHHFPHWYALIHGSPAHWFSAQFHRSANLMCNGMMPGLLPLGVPGVRDEDAVGNLFYRNAAWTLHHTVLCWWIAAGDEPAGFSRADIEAYLHLEFGKIASWLKPRVDDARNTAPYAVGLRRFGVPLTYNTEKRWWESYASSLHYYYASAFVALRSCGLWDILRRNRVTATGLDFLLSCLARASVDFILDAHHLETFDTDFGRPPRLSPVGAPMNDASSVYASWADAARHIPPVGRQSWRTDANGNGWEGVMGIHLRVQFAAMLPQWFPELGYPRAIRAGEVALARAKAWWNEADSAPSRAAMASAGPIALNLSMTPFASRPG